MRTMGRHEGAHEGAGGGGAASDVVPRRRRSSSSRWGKECLEKEQECMTKGLCTIGCPTLVNCCTAMNFRHLAGGVGDAAATLAATRAESLF